MTTQTRTTHSGRLYRSPAGYFYRGRDLVRPIAKTEQEVIALGYDPAQAKRPARQFASPITPRTEAAIVVFAILIALFLILLGSPAHAQGETLTPTQRHAAEVAKGEAPISLVGVDGFVGVLCTMQARLADSRFPDTYAGMLRAYYAPPQPLSAQEEAIAVDVLVYGAECGGGPFLYALSAQDVAGRGLRPGDWVTVPHILPSGVEMAIHFYATSPWAAQ